MRKSLRGKPGVTPSRRLPAALPPGVTLLQTLSGHNTTVGDIAWSHDGQRIASACNDGIIRLWNAGTGELVASMKGHQDAALSVAWSTDDSIIASGSTDGMVRLWRASTGKLQKNLAHPNIVQAVRWSAGGVLATGCNDARIRLFDATGTLIRIFSGPDVNIVSLAWSHDDSLLASGTNGAGVWIWDLETGELVTKLASADAVPDVGFAADRRLVAFSDRHGVSVGDADDEFDLVMLEGDSATYDGSVAFSPSHPLLASRGHNAVNVWHRETWRLAQFRADSHEGIAFHPHRPVLAVAMTVPRGKRVQAICLLELDPTVLFRSSATAPVTYTSAKVVLVGESNAGKSYLAHRIATGAAPVQGAISSTHGMRFWPLQPSEPASSNKKTSAPASDGDSASLLDALFSVSTRKTQRSDIVLWDMGGQEEYRLIHQLFLGDTTVALVLFDPTRGVTAFKEVEAWNRALEKQLRGNAVKLLVGAKVDQPSDMVDLQAIERLRVEGGFASYIETSAVTGRGIAELCAALGKAIDWKSLGKTTRPELFQRIRDEIERRRKLQEVVVPTSVLIDALGASKDDDIEDTAVDAVSAQLAMQGVLARSRLSTGEPVLVLQVQEIERYAGSLIVAARNNPRGVPALELRAIGQEGFSFPAIRDQDRLPRDHERTVVECTVQLMLQYGVCFQHEGLLIFPSLFAPAPEVLDTNLPHAVSLYYDFAGAIDNIYSALVAWLVLSKAFGKVRLWAERAEFETPDGGLCGLRKVGRPGGFAHVDVYFTPDTAVRPRKEFISFVEDHLTRSGVEIREHVAIKCPCGHTFDEETIRQRIARGNRDVKCPVCDKPHNLEESAAATRERDPQIAASTWALRTLVDKRREESSRHAVQLLAEAVGTSEASRPIRVLHLSDLHFVDSTPVEARLQWLLDDLKRDEQLKVDQLDHLVISGDFTDRGAFEGFDRAYQFVSGLTQAFGLSAERCIFVPGNHDVHDLDDAYEWRRRVDGLKDGEWVRQGDIILARNADKYPLRLKPFSDKFFHKFLQRPYPLDSVLQAFSVPFWETGLQFLCLNSCPQIDEFHRKRAGVDPRAVAQAIKQAQNQEADARATGKLASNRPVLRIAVWHHAVAGPEQMKDTEFLGNLQKNGVRLALHGDVHEQRRDLIGYWHEKKLHVVGAGSFGARAQDRPESSPRLYNMLEISRDLRSCRVYTRSQTTPDGPWDGWHTWPDPNGGSGRVAFYDLTW